MSSKTTVASGSNPLHPRHMTPAERRAELCAILALGLVRLRAQQSTELSDAEERVRYTSRPPGAVMQTGQLTGEPHDHP